MWELGIKPSHHITNYEKSTIVSIISFSFHVYVMPERMLHPGIETVVCMWRTEVNFRYLYWFLTFFKLCLSMDLELSCLASLVSQQAPEIFLSLLPGNCHHMFAVLACSCTCWGSKADLIGSTLLNNPSHLCISFYQQLSSSPTKVLLNVENRKLNDPW